MTRLADALQRAHTSSSAPASRPKAETAAFGRHEIQLPPARSALAASFQAPAGTALIAAPTAADRLGAWRSDPELVGKLVGTEDFSSAAQEQYRKLAASLHVAQSERGIKVVMTASALPGEGKSLTAVNLALTLSESYHRRVFLIDADLRRPTIQRVFGLPPIAGLTEGLKAPQDRAMAVTQVADRLFVLPAGRPDPDPMSGLTSERMKRLVSQATGTFDWVIVDTPPIGILPDASLLSVWVDAVLLVIRAGKAPFGLVKRTVEALGHDRIMGVVMNAVDFAHDRNAGGYYEYYGYGYYGASRK